MCAIAIFSQRLCFFFLFFSLSFSLSSGCNLFFYTYMYLLLLDFAIVVICFHLCSLGVIYFCFALSFCELVTAGAAATTNENADAPFEDVDYL